MKPRRSRIIVGIAVVLAALVIIAILYSRANAKASTASSLQTATAKIGTLSAAIATNGTVRAQQSATLDWQNTGSVGTVNAQMGDVVTAGQELASLSPEQMPQNVISAAVDLAAAQQTLDNLLHSTMPQANAQKALQDAQAAIDNYKNNFPATQAAAKAALTTAQYNLTVVQNQKATVQYAKASPADIEAARATLVLAQNALDATSNANSKASDLPTSDPRRSQALTNLSDAEKKLESAQRKLNWYLTYPTAQDIANADAAVLAAQAALATAQQGWDAVKDGANTTQMAVLQAAFADAQNAYDLIKNGASQGDVAAVNARISGDQFTLNTMKITAPFSGTVTNVSVLPNDQVSSGTAAFTINDLSHLFIDVSVAETNLSKVHEGQAVEFAFNAISGKTYHGKVVKVAQVGTSSQGVVNFGVTVEITDADKNIRMGMAATVSIITASKANVLLVLNRAITTTGTQHTVNVLFEGSQVSLSVTVGVTNGTLTEITGGGLKEGDVVVLNAVTTSSRITGGFGGAGGPPGGFGD